MTLHAASDPSETLGLLRRASDAQQKLLTHYVQSLETQSEECNAMALENARLTSENEQQTHAKLAMEKTIEELKNENFNLQQDLQRYQTQSEQLLLENSSCRQIVARMQIDANLAGMLGKVLQHERCEMRDGSVVTPGSVVWVMDPRMGNVDHIVKRQVVQDDIQGNVTIGALTFTKEYIVPKKYIFVTTFTAGDLVSVPGNVFGQVTCVLPEHCMVLVVNQDSSSLHAQIDIVLQEYMPGDKIKTKSGEEMIISKYKAINNTIQLSNDSRQRELLCSDVIFVSRDLLS